MVALVDGYPKEESKMNKRVVVAVIAVVILVALIALVSQIVSSHNKGEALRAVNKAPTAADVEKMTPAERAAQRAKMRDGSGPIAPPTGTVTK